MTNDTKDRKCICGHPPHDGEPCQGFIEDDGVSPCRCARKWRLRDAYAEPITNNDFIQADAADKATEATLPDIVQRLRGPIAHSFASPRDEQAIKDCLFAADEIERLRTDLANAQHIVANRQTAAEAKIVALREVSSGDDVNLDKLLADVRSIING